MRETPEPGGRMDELVSTLISDGKEGVTSNACSQVCEEFKMQYDRDRKSKSKMKKKRKKKNKSQKGA